MKIRQILAAALAMLASAMAGAQQMAIAPLPPIQPDRQLILRVPEAAQPVRLARVGIEVTVVGRLAKTTIELAFRNPNARVLEGELQFPLLEGQQVSGLALDFDGKWRPAVPVEKARGQEIFEEVIRGRIDPALLEATQGNNYKLRVYPIPALGERKVSLTLSERLPQRRDGSVLLRLPLAFGGKLDQFDLRINAPGMKPADAKLQRGLAGARWETQGGAALIVQKRDYQPEDWAEVVFAAPTGDAVTSEEFAGKTYFYADLAVPKMAPGARAKPARVALVWDASGSGATRDHGREFALLDAWFKAVGSVQVNLTMARDVAEEGGGFNIVNGDWTALRAALEKVVYDGATNPAAFLPKGVVGGDTGEKSGQVPESVLLFSDGLTNFGVAAMPAFPMPVFAVSAAVTADGERLRQVAEKSGGAFVDLLKTSPAVAAKVLRQAAPRLVSLRSNGARDLVAGAPDAEGRMAIAGVLNDAATTVELDWQTPNGGRERQVVKVARGDGKAAFAAQAWARLKLTTLLPEQFLHSAEIVRLGKAFGLVTPGTSLIVLDRVEDYVRYEIVPPPELRGEYERQIAAGRQQRERDRAAHLEEIVRRFKEKQAWWEREFPKGERPKPKEVAKVGGAVTLDTAARPAPVAMQREQLRAGAVPMAMPAVASPSGEASKMADAMTSAASIQLKKWVPDAPYADRLRKADADQLYRVYLDERPGWANSTAFFLDAADVFFERGQPERAIRVLSNLAEMDLENRAILRILAYRLVQAKRADLAVLLLERVRELAPNEPQSWRDLGLALADLGERQKAVEALYQVVVRPWHNRFPDIELVALAELNAIVATAPGKLDTSAFDPRLLRNLPLDLRVVLAWDADNTDIDLWVTDPNGEKAFFGNRLSYQGGAMSRDFTGGYGPEEFSLKKAKPGKYLVQAQFYGHRQQVVAGATTLSLRLFTGFGTAAQKEERVTLRLKGRAEVVTVGEFVVGDPGRSE